MARELAEARGTTLTEPVASALDATVGTAEPEVLLAEVAEIQSFVSDLPDRDPRHPSEILNYDEVGLPR